MKRSRKILFVLIGGLLILVLGGCLLYWIKVIHPLRVFHSEEINSIPQFDALNEDVLKKLPEPPPGVELISSGTTGILGPSNMHGRVLRLAYSIDGDIDFDSILMLYQNGLEPNGWYRLPKSQDDIVYYRGSSCVEIIIIAPSEEYNIDIWHDFLSQSFSPTLPPARLLTMRDFYETDILTCPPDKATLPP